MLLASLLNIPFRWEHSYIYCRIPFPICGGWNLKRHLVFCLNGVVEKREGQVEGSDAVSH